LQKFIFIVLGNIIPETQKKQSLRAIDPGKGKFLEETNLIPVGQAAKPYGASGVLPIFNLSGQTESLSYLTLKPAHIRVGCLKQISFLEGARRRNPKTCPGNFGWLLRWPLSV
jgi:hypothetical protein